MTPSEGRIAHHDLCFGCGLANPFGLQLELAETDGGELRGRFFVKQDHQGADGAVHEGLLAAALIEAMALAAAPSGVAAVTRLELDVSGRAPVGTYVEVRAVDAPGEGGR